MRLKRIYLDMDDVCNKFTMYALYVMECCISICDDKSFNPEWGWDIVKAANELQKIETFTTASFWDELPEQAWSETPISEEYKFLLTWAAGTVGRPNVFFLTTPTLCPLSCSGKLKWIKRYAPEWMQRQYVITPRKACCANENSLLIDDKESNVIDFIETGGHAVLVPRPWNSAHNISKGGSRVAYLQHRLELIQKGCKAW